MKIGKLFELLLDLPKTIIINFYYLPIKQVIKLPIRVSHNVRIRSLGRRNYIKLDEG